MTAGVRIFVGCASSVLLFSSAALAQMQCEGRLIEVGETAAAVERDCGEPAQRTRSERIVQSGLIDSPASERLRIPVERWTYEKPGEFTRTLVFENGTLVRIETGNYPDLEEEP